LTFPSHHILFRYQDYISLVIHSRDCLNQNLSCVRDYLNQNPSMRVGFPCPIVVAPIINHPTFHSNCNPHCTWTTTTKRSTSYFRWHLETNPLSLWWSNSQLQGHGSLVSSSLPTVNDLHTTTRRAKIYVLLPTVTSKISDRSKSYFPQPLATKPHSTSNSNHRPSPVLLPTVNEPYPTSNSVQAPSC
jgi:hypothetical protein